MTGLRLGRLIPWLLLAIPAPVAGQHAVHLAVEPSLVGWWTHSAIGPSTQTLSGWAFGGDGSVGWRRLSLYVGYWQGSLNPDSVGTASRDVVEGYVLLGGKILPWLELRAGPHAWAYTANAGTQRWALFEARGRAEGALIGKTLSTYFELWTALGGDVNAAQSFGSGLGGQGGIVYHDRRLPLWGRLGYSVEQARLTGDVWKETVQRVVLGFGYTIR